MVNSISICDELFRTNSTSIWFLSGVSPYMIYPAGLVLKDFSAILIWALVNFPTAWIANLFSLIMLINSILCGEILKLRFTALTLLDHKSFQAHLVLLPIVYNLGSFFCMCLIFLSIILHHDTSLLIVNKLPILQLHR